MTTFIQSIKSKKRFFILLVAILILLPASVLYTCRYFGASKPAFGQPIRHGSDSRDAVAFTCNVDWGGEYLPDMLRIFKAADIKATFFVTGRWAENNQELTRLIADSGHTVANHGYSHKDHSKLDYRQNQLEIDRTQAIIERVTGIRPVFFAPPSGAYNEHTVKASKDLGCKIVLWSIDTIDWKRDGTEKIISRVGKKLHSGGIILMHPTDQTLEALPIIIKNVKDRGYEIISLEDIVKTIEN